MVDTSEESPLKDKAPSSASKNAQKAQETVSALFEVARFWGLRAWRIALRMAKGAYLVQERRELLERLGEEAAEAARAGKWTPSDASKPLLEQLARTERKIRLEEYVIARLRFRDGAGAPPPSTGSPFPGAGPHYGAD